MHPMVTLSLGATCPDPATTCRGTMKNVDAAAAAAPRTKSRRLVVMANLF
jgi:hypothetical protein